MLKTILNVVSSGLIMGGVYAIIAMGMSIQYGVARILNVSHGEFIMVGAFLTYALVKLNVNPLLAMVLILPVMFLLGFVLHRTIYKKLSDVSGSAAAFESNSMLISFGLMFVLQNVALQIWGSQQKTYAFLQSKVTILGTDIALNRLVVLLFAVAISLLFYLFLQKVRLGKAIRAVSQDAASAALMGVKVHRVSAVCFGIGAVLAGCAGSLISIINQFNTSIGMSYTIIAIIVVVLGGMVLVETIFNWPGVGQFAYKSVMSADFPSIIGVSLLIALNYMVINTVVDILYGVIDPRVRCQ